MTDEIEDDAVSSGESFDDMELAYREALRSIEAAEYQVGSALREFVEDDSDQQPVEESAFVSIGEELAEDLKSGSVAEPRLISDGPSSSRVSPSSVIEAALFVGGDVALTARRLASLIGQDTEARVAVRLIDQLNERYSEEHRPYEIRLHEGGFRLELREEFAEVRMKVFGYGPREVRLSPESLEVLAYIAYNQPVDRTDLEQIRSDGGQAIVRQLIRLRLVELERTGSRRNEVAYRTGDRFLKLFSLDDLDDLPHADVFRFK
ncbi:MAG: SMC-Scp complex subunit ScpB [Planctomycetaceae bacterium]|nr:SMC-Scp complex subunit ScpB [Planctomycetaceae bacterium]